MFGTWLKDIPRGAINLTGGAIALLLVALLMFLSWALIFRELPANNREAVLMLLGIVSTNVGTVVAWYYGTSYGSQKKSEAITELTKAKP